MYNKINIHFCWQLKKEKEKYERDESHEGKPPKQTRNQTEEGEQRQNHRIIVVAARAPRKRESFPTTLPSSARPPEGRKGCPFLGFSPEGGRGRVA